MTDALVDNTAEHQYELHVDGALAALVVYEVQGSTITLIHTEVKPEFEGQGVGGRIAKAVLDDARARGWRVVPRCPFIAAYIERHPGYTDLTTGPGAAP